MSNRTPKNVRTIETYELEAKDLVKGDPLWIGKRVHTVKTNTKVNGTHRKLTLEWGSQNKADRITLVVPKHLKFSVTKHVVYNNR